MDANEFYLALEQSSYYKTQIVKKKCAWLTGVTPLWFYFRIFQTVMRSYLGLQSDKKYSTADLKLHAYAAISAIEELGGSVEISGLDNVKKLHQSAIFIGNHMSALETFLLPAILLHITPITFVLKASLLRYPIFGKVLQVLDPIQVERKDPRADLKVVLEEGSHTVQNGRSVIIFPQQTRTTEIERDSFNSLGIKLAKRVNAPIIPVAIKTDFWGNGKLVKDLGKIKINEQVIIEFGEPLQVMGRGKEEHGRVFEFIRTRVSSWQKNGNGIRA